MTLVIAEKPALGKAIAQAMMNNASFEPKGNVISLNWNGEDVNVIWCFGHLLTLKTPEDYNPKFKKWNLEDLPLFFEDWGKKPIPDTGGQGGSSKADRVAQIGELLKQANRVIHAGDPDDEGQYLIDEVLEWHNYRGPVMRLSTVDTSLGAMKKALANMEVNDITHTRIGLSAKARSISDMVFGFNLSRYYTMINDGKITLRVGRVQTPTLGLVVRRDMTIEGHEKVKHYGLSAKILLNNQDHVVAKFVPAKDNSRLEEGRILDKGYIDYLMGQIKASSPNQGTIGKKKSTQAPPLPFNLTKLTSYCSQKFGMDPTAVMASTQRLRDNHGAITYNRSDCQYLSMEVHKEAPDTVPIVAENMGIAGQHPLDTSLVSKCFNDKIVSQSAHMGIIPTATKQDLEKFTAIDRNVYEIIAKYYLAQFLPPAEKVTTGLMTAQSADGMLVAKHTALVKSGFLALLKGAEEQDGEGKDDDSQDAQNERLSQYGEGKYPVRLEGIDITEAETKPPARYTQASLAEDMTRIARYVENEKVKKLLMQKDKDKEGENGSIGTTATRPFIITGLIKSGLLEEVTKGKKSYLVSSKLGREFYNILPDSARKVDVTAGWYFLQECIKTGEKQVDDMTHHVLKSVQTIINSREGIMEGLEETASGKVGTCLGKCPKCGGEIYETAKTFKCFGGNGCKFAVYKNNPYMKKVLGKDISRKIMECLLTHNMVRVGGLKTKNGGTYDAIIKVDFSGERPEFKFDDGENAPTIGKCPKCGGEVKEKGPAFRCNACDFALWKTDKFFASWKIRMTEKVVADMLKNKEFSTKQKTKDGKKSYTKKISVDFSEQWPKYTVEPFKKV